MIGIYLKVTEMEHIFKSSSFSANFKAMFEELHDKANYCDVTLVCDDKIQFKVHKIVIVTWSKVFREIINGNPSHHPLIYLRGIQHQEMRSILQFMYLGEGSFSQERLALLIKVAEDLEIEDLVNNLSVRDW